MTVRIITSIFSLCTMIAYSQTKLIIEQQNGTIDSITVKSISQIIFSMPAIPNFIAVTGGTFTMGSPNGVGSSAEQPQHTVSLSDFYISNTEIRWGAWDTVYQWGLNNGYSDLPVGRKGYNGDAAHPVTEVNWYDIVKWCNARSEKEGLIPYYYTGSNHTSSNVYRTGQIDLEKTMVYINSDGYRLPTEAEWEYAAQGGYKRHNPHFMFSGSNSVETVAWYSTNSNNNSHLVATKSPNELGTYDMSGNVWEWCWDWYGSYNESAQTNPFGVAMGTSRVVRGGSFDNIESHSRVTNRIGNTPTNRYNVIGFRVVKNVK